MRKLKKIILIITISLIILLVLLLLVAFIISSNYKFVCVREEEELAEIYSYEFNLFGEVKNFTYVTEVSFKSEETANQYYNDILSTGDVDKNDVELEETSVIFNSTSDAQKLGENIIEIRQIHSNVGYTCGGQKK